MHKDIYVEHTLHSHMVQGSFFHRSPSVRSCPSLSVQSVLLRRASSLLICKDTRTEHLSQRSSHCLVTSTLQHDSLTLATDFTKHEPHIHENVCTSVQYELLSEGYCHTESSTSTPHLDVYCKLLCLSSALQLTRGHSQDAGPHPEELTVPLTC